MRCVLVAATALVWCGCASSPEPRGVRVVDGASIAGAVAARDWSGAAEALRTWRQTPGVKAPRVAWHDEAVLWLRAGRGVPARKALGDAPTSEQLSDHWRYLESISFAVVGDTEHAAKRLAPLASRDEVYEDAYLAVLMRSRAFDEATNYLRSQIERYPDRPDYWQKLSRVLFTADMKGDALAVLKDAHRAFPENAPIATHYAQSLYELGRPREATIVWGRARAKDAEEEATTRGRNAAISALRGGDYSRAARLFRGIAQTEPCLAPLGEGYARAALQDDTSALPLLMDATRTCPGLSAPLELSAVCFRLQQSCPLGHEQLAHRASGLPTTHRASTLLRLGDERKAASALSQSSVAPGGQTR